MQTQNEHANSELERWRKAFQNDSILPSGTTPGNKIILKFENSDAIFLYQN